MVLRALMSRPTGERPTGAMGRALDRLDTVIYEEIERRRHASDVEQRADIMSLLLLARDEDGEAMTDGELRDELVTLLLAGHETTATSVAWALERLVRHPDKLARLIAEVDARAEGGGDEYMTAVVNETLRVRPVVPLVVRLLMEELEVGGYQVAGGHAGGAVDLSDEPQPAGVRAPTRVPSRALPRGGRWGWAGDQFLLVDPVWRRHPPLYRRVVCADGDEGDPEDDAQRARAARAERLAGSSRRADPQAGGHVGAVCWRERGVEAALLEDVYGPPTGGGVGS